MKQTNDSTRQSCFHLRVHYWNCDEQPSFHPALYRIGPKLTAEVGQIHRLSKALFNLQILPVTGQSTGRVRRIAPTGVIHFHSRVPVLLQDEKRISLLFSLLYKILQMRIPTEVARLKK